MNRDCIFCSHVGECNYTPSNNEVMPSASDVDEFCRDGGSGACNRFSITDDMGDNEFSVKIEVVVHIHAPDSDTAIMQALAGLRNEGFDNLNLLNVERR